VDAEFKPPIDPLDTAQLEQYMLESSGLLKVRPPLPAAASGDDFYHAIPFQVCGLIHALCQGRMFGPNQKHFKTSMIAHMHQTEDSSPPPTGPTDPVLESTDCCIPCFHR